MALKCGSLPRDAGDLAGLEIWAVTQRRAYQKKVHTIDELKQRLIAV